MVSRGSHFHFWFYSLLLKIILDLPLLYLTTSSVFLSCKTLILVIVFILIFLWVFNFISWVQALNEIISLSTAGKISRRVSIVHYPDAKELEERKSNNKTHTHRNSAGVTVTTSSRYFPMQSGNPRSLQSSRAASSKGSRKSSLSEVTEPSNAAERRPVSNKDKSSGRKVSELSHGHSTGISSMSSDHTHGGKSKRRKHKE